MSLIRQLWLAVVISALLAFAGSLFISIWSARTYLVQQLERKNSDNAGSLALSMTQQEKDPVMIDLQVAALFDTGYYESIAVVDPQGKLIAQRVQEKRETDVPGWFSDALPIPSKPGLGQINDGWKQYGTVQVVSHNHFAYQALWEQSLRLVLWFVVGGALVGAFGMLVLRAIGRSLNNVVAQAGAIGERRFVTIEEPKTPELKFVARAMNSMVGRIKQMFAEEAARLEELRHRVNYDGLTGLPNRDYFMAYFREVLGGVEAAQFGVLALVRLPDLDKLNQLLGRNETDRLLRETGQVFLEFAQQNKETLAGRVKAGDIALVLPGNSDTQEAGQRLVALLDERLRAKWPTVSELYHVGVVGFLRGESLGEVFSRADNALALARGKGANAWHAIEGGGHVPVIPGEQWRALLTGAVKAGSLRLVFYPVMRQEGVAVHQEGMIRLQVEPDSPSMTAADFMPMAAHLNLTAPIDLEVIRLAIRHLAMIEDDVAVNLSAETISNWGFRNELSELLGSLPELCPRLWFEVPEYGAFKHFEAFKDLCRTLKGLGCHVGVEHFGQRLSDSQMLTELGLDYVKIHSSLVQGIEENSGNQEFLKRFCAVAHSVGIIVIAVGVRSEAELSTLKSLGVDGATGPVLSSQPNKSVQA